MSLSDRVRRLEAMEAPDWDDAFLERMYAYRDDPHGFQRDVLGRQLWSRQVDVCNAVARSPVTVVPAGRAVGKSYLLSGLVLWYLYAREGARVITTGPDFRQVVSVLWSELRRAVGRAAEELPFESLTGNSYASPQRLVISSRDRHEALGWASVGTEHFSGQHAADLMVIVDEASGVHPDIFSAIDGLSAAKLVICGNPLRYEGRFRELHDMATAGAAGIVTVPISSLESPDADKERSPVGLADGGFLRFVKSMYGELSPWYRSNILGQFPGAESQRFFNRAWLDACTDEGALADALWLDYAPGPMRIAVDIAAGVGADRSVVVVRDDRRLHEIYASSWCGIDGECTDPRHTDLSARVCEMATRWGVPPRNVTYDAAGIGAHFGSHLSGIGFAGAVGYFGAGKGGKYAVNRRSANALALRRRLDPAGSDFVPFYAGGIPLWPALREELLALNDAPMEIIEGTVRQAVETKESVMARLKRSPDLMDAFIQSFTYRGD